MTEPSKIEVAFRKLEKVWFERRELEKARAAAAKVYIDLAPVYPKDLFRLEPLIRDADRDLPRLEGTQFLDVSEDGLRRLRDIARNESRASKRALELLNAYEPWSRKTETLRELTGLAAAEEADGAEAEEFYLLIGRIREARATSFRDVAIQIICLVLDTCEFPDEETIAIHQRMAELAGLKTPILLEDPMYNIASRPRAHDSEEVRQEAAKANHGSLS